MRADLSCVEAVYGVHNSITGHAKPRASWTHERHFEGVCSVVQHWQIVSDPARQHSEAALNEACQSCQHTWKAKWQNGKWNTQQHHTHTTTLHLAALLGRASGTGQTICNVTSEYRKPCFGSLQAAISSRSPQVAKDHYKWQLYPFKALHFVPPTHAGIPDADASLLAQRKPSHLHANIQWLWRT